MFRAGASTGLALATLSTLSTLCAGEPLPLFDDFGDSHMLVDTKMLDNTQSLFLARLPSLIPGVFLETTEVTDGKANSGSDAHVASITTACSFRSSGSRAAISRAAMEQYSNTCETPKGLITN